jgi:hypothetical protein
MSTKPGKVQILSKKIAAVSSANAIFSPESFPASAGSFLDRSFGWLHLH